MLTYVLVLSLGLIGGRGATRSNRVAPLQKALSAVNKTVDDLGYRPKGYWTRYPDPALIPHKLHVFDDLFAEPLRIYDYARSLGNVAEDYLSDEYREEHRNSLHRIFYFFGVEPKITGFRNYSANLNPLLPEDRPLLFSLLQLRAFISGQMNTGSFGGEYDTSEVPLDLVEEIKSIPEALRKPIAGLILNLLDALRWIELSRRNVNPELIERAFAIDDLDETQSGGSVYYFELDDIEASLDRHSLYYGAIKALQAAKSAAWTLDSLLKTGIDASEVDLSFKTPAGKVLIKGSENDSLEVENCLLLLDLGGDDVWRGSVGATSNPLNPLSVAIDLAGNDRYVSEGFEPSQGAGIAGVGLLVDWSGDDIYRGGKLVQGASVSGVGFLYDNEGKDDYRAETMAQGCGFFGAGILADRKGDDSYYLFGNGQGDGEMGGCGVLVDRYGDDSYVAEPYSEVYDRGDYHSKYKINGNNAQGFGGGRRGDGSDGHSWAGGLGALLDIEGDDKYVSGNWSLGTGYWYGIGILYDKAGDDLYKSCYFTQASGAHYAIGALIDESGNDKHLLFETAGAALAFGWDFVSALFVDKSGNDEYDAKIISIGVSEIRSNALFFDLGGDDLYRVKAKTLKLGASDFREGYRTPNRYSPYLYYTSSFGLFLDTGGDDRYELKEVKEGKTYPFKNDTLWLQPSPGEEKYGAENYGIGMDCECGPVEPFEIFDREEK